MQILVRNGFLAPALAASYPTGRSRQAHDTAFSIGSALTEKMDGKLQPGEREAFHRLVYDTCKEAVEPHDIQRDRECDRVRGYAPAWSGVIPAAGV